MSLSLLAVIAAILILQIVGLGFMWSLPRESPTQQHFTAAMTFAVGLFNIPVGLLVVASNAGLVRLIGLGLVAFGIYAVRDAILRRRALRANYGAPSDSGNR